jgi:lincosamide nucleotidyltransferase A/C/D/E
MFLPDGRAHRYRLSLMGGDMTPEMTSCELTGIYRQMEMLGIESWIDGGWGVDALLEKQTRTHADLDIVVQEKDLAAVVAFLQRRGFYEMPRDDSRPWNFVMGDGKGKEIDLHVIVLDAEGNGLYGPPECGEGMYPADALGGKGTIDRIPVRCISAEFQIRSHTGYALSDKDIKDVTALAQKFGWRVSKGHLRGFTVSR